MNSEVKIVEDINENFDRIDFLGFNVIRMKKNNYINGTKICNDISKELKKDKQIRYWMKLDKTKEYIKFIKNIHENSEGKNLPSDN
jgi:hypothetical protein